MRELLRYIFLYLKGLLIGTTGVLQGVSGAAMAVLVGEYQNLVRAIGQINIRRPFSRADSGAKTSGERKRLISMTAGIITGLLTLRALFSSVVYSNQILTASFFSGLILVVAFLWLRKINRWNAGAFLAFTVGVAVSYAWTCIRPIMTPDTPVMALVTGIFAGTTFVLPGVSDVFMAMFFGKYRYILTSFGSLEYEAIIPFIAGGIFAIVGVAKVLAKLLAAYYSPVVALLSGWMIGSLNRVWPWREAIEYTTTLEGNRIPAFDRSILPWQYLEITGKDPYLFQAILAMAAGVFMVVLFEKIAARLKTKH